MKREKKEHRKIWKKYHGAIPEGYVIHHKDGNKKNNNIENLQAMKSEEHLSLHHAGLKKKGHKAFNKTNKEIRKKIFELAKEVKKINGHPNYSEIARRIGSISNFTIARILKGE